MGGSSPDYFRKRRAAGKGTSGKSGKGGKHASLFDIGEFVAIDGEGFNRGDEITRTVGDDNRLYRYREHEYALLSASDGSELYNPVGRLRTKDCLDFLLRIRETNRHAILVCFGASYDMTHMLAFGLDRAEIDYLLHGEGDDQKSLDVTLSDDDGVQHDYRLLYRPRKSLSVWRWEHGADKYERHRKKDGSVIWRMTKCAKAVLWDVWGFFQGSFVEALKNWLPNDPDTKLIAEMKAKRSTFERVEIATVRTYNAKELRCLVDMMDRVRDGVRGMGLRITRWDGAGAISGAMLAAHGIKDHMADSPPQVFEAACAAYSGGHIEACKIGHYIGTVHHYDINSAYPDQFRNLPSLVSGTWQHGDGSVNPAPGFTLVRLQYRFYPGLPFYPLFYREPNGSIKYPERGAGWYWFPEYDAARAFRDKLGAIEFTVVEWWHYRPAGNVSPFMFIEELYEQRKAIVAETKRTGIPNGAEKMMKLGYNGGYGKSVQQVGARIDKDGTIHKPAFFQIEWGGYVTAGCRAKLMQAAIEKPDAIISFATDGLFSTEPLNLYTPKDKILGAWEYQQHIGITIVMPGIYWLYDEATEKQSKAVKGYSRGFDKETMSDADFIHKAWKEGKEELNVKSSRMVTLGTACMSDTFWEMRGCFVETDRNLRLTGFNSKRHAIAVKGKKLHATLHPTWPQDLDEDYDMSLDSLASAPYPITWLQKHEDAREAPEVADMTDADRSFLFDFQAMTLA